jgi:hypothetical protein
VETNDQRRGVAKLRQDEYGESERPFGSCVRGRMLDIRGSLYIMFLKPDASKMYRYHVLLRGKFGPALLNHIAAYGDRSTSAIEVFLFLFTDVGGIKEGFEPSKTTSGNVIGPSKVKSVSESNVLSDNTPLNSNFLFDKEFMCIVMYVDQLSHWNHWNHCM